MSKHTPGPWHRNIKPASKYTTVWSGRNKHVAHVETRGLTEAEIEANISLIAAAPDLLDALINFVNAAEHCGGEDDPITIAAREAVRKATEPS